MRQKTYSQTAPAKEKFIIENIRNGQCTVLFFDNIEEINNDNEKSYCYDFYKIIIDYRENLEKDINNKFEKWLNFAKINDYKQKAIEVRNKRDSLLLNTDWTQMADATLSEDQKQKYKKYRQELRDIPQQADFPYDVKFPKKV